MKLRLEQMSDGEEEVLVRYRQMTPKIQAICDLVEEGRPKILVSHQRENSYLFLDDILYFESVDGKTFAYTQAAVHEVGRTLKDLSASYANNGFFRASKSLLVNIYHIASFKSQSFGRIEALLDNDEVVVISRKYAGQLRQVLEEGVQDES
ncbi:LytTR family DNA-binding domain-containing protein [Streptococcus downei]|uniref:LytR/AlgR family transcriptional regulator n=1 Tax=Streptococcus downei MFe28 TaxID=764290 RepID=A0A380JH83_STRDO|nr:LytTR family DNA-binding domain-containing protein [Streptococcus downei]EFQ57625.1 LytTr DNA-binding domain protein [Streptococcus downei F0415]SUN36464.1 LytR/AlgR family transcriptional regulator [Streptococcus downei MFe28]